MLRWLEGSHIQLGVSQFSQCNKWYTLKYKLQYKSLSNKQGCQDSMMLQWLDGSHIQLVVCQFRQCIQCYTLKYIYYSTRVYQTSKVVKTVWCSDGLRGPISSLESVSLVSVISDIPWNINYSIRVYQTSKVVKTVWCSNGLRGPISSL